MITVRTSFKDHDGKELGSVEESEVVYTWDQLFLVFLWPFEESADAFIDAIARDLHRATLIDAAQRGWLEARPDSSPAAAAP